LTLERGRIYLTNLKDKAPATVRIRFANPAAPDDHKEAWDVTLAEKGAEVLVERFSYYPADVPFFTPDPKSPERLGPTALMTLVVMNGQVNLKYRDNAEGLQAPPGAAVMGWSSTKGNAVQPQHLNKLPEAAKPNPQLPADLPNRKQAEQLRADMDRA